MQWSVLLLVILCLVMGCSEKKTDDEFKIVLRLSHVFSPKEDLAISMENVAKNVFEKT
ncbi:MAG: TRAP-type C4-dicarboxylate transport system substrate-binding protein, partial [Colwellia sp.]